MLMSPPYNYRLFYFPKISKTNDQVVRIFYMISNFPAITQSNLAIDAYRDDPFLPTL